MRNMYIVSLVWLLLASSLDSAMAQSEAISARDAFITKFQENYQGEYILNPSVTCQPVRKATTVKVDMLKNGAQRKIRVIYQDERGTTVGSKLYPLNDGRIGTVNSASTQPNSLLWETNVTDRSTEAESTGTLYERMTFNDDVLSFDVLKKRDPVGMFRFFKPTETVGETRCNFTRTEVMKATAKEGKALRREQPNGQRRTDR